MDDDLRIGRFPVVRELGRGAFAAVYLARDVSLDRDVAIKVLTRVMEATDVRRFLDEGHYLAQFNDPHIVLIHESGTHEGAPFLVMEYVPGGTVAELMAVAVIRMPPAGCSKTRWRDLQLCTARGWCTAT